MRCDRPFACGQTGPADFSADLLLTASFYAWAINTHLGRVWEVAGVPIYSIELRASPPLSFVHVLHLVSFER